MLNNSVRHLTCCYHRHRLIAGSWRGEGVCVAQISRGKEQLSFYSNTIEGSLSLEQVRIWLHIVMCLLYRSQVTTWLHTGKIYKSQTVFLSTQRRKTKSKNIDGLLASPHSLSFRRRVSVSGWLFLLYIFGNKKDPISVCVLHSYANYLRGQSKNSCTLSSETGTGSGRVHN